MALPKRLKLRFDAMVNRWRTLISRLRGCCETFPDERHGANPTYPIADIGIAAFSVFFMQSPSFLAHHSGCARATASRIAKACSS